MILYNKKIYTLKELRKPNTRGIRYSSISSRYVFGLKPWLIQGFKKLIMGSFNNRLYRIHHKSHKMHTIIELSY